MFHETEYGAEVSAVPRFAPSSLNWTDATPTLSEALADTVTVPLTVEPFDGEVIKRRSGGVPLTDWELCIRVTA